MKSIRNVTLSALLTLGLFTAVSYTACNKDECKDVVCKNGGICDVGTCECLTGFEGVNCETASASKATGTFSSTESCQPPVSGGGNWSSTITQSSNDQTRIVISNFGDSGGNVTAKVNLNAITIDQTVISGNTVTGTGTISGNTITINYNLTGGTIDYNCTMTMIRQ